VDAAVLEITFACASGQSQDFVFNYTFASEEYNEVRIKLLAGRDHLHILSSRLI
jgi:hypothetical protein